MYLNEANMNIVKGSKPKKLINECTGMRKNRNIIKGSNPITIL